VPWWGEASDLDDRRPEKILVVGFVIDDDICHSMAHLFKNMTILACLSASSDALTLMTIIFYPIKNSLSADSLRQDEDAMIRRRTPLNISQKSFGIYFNSEYSIC
jgi:hypothetical protein